MKAAAYARYSTDRQTDNSIAAQLDAIIGYCQKNNISIARTYVDEAQSGTNTDRKGFFELLNDARGGKFNAVVIYDISRGSRDVADWFTFRKEMQANNIAVLSVTEKLGDISNPNDFLVELINVGLGQHMVLQTRQKSRAGVAQKAKDAVFLGGVAPLGYDIVEQKYVINEHEATAVRLIFDYYAEGSSYDVIIDELSSKGFKGKKGQVIGRSSLNAILQNKRYIGVYSWNEHQNKYMGKWAGGKKNPDAVVIKDAMPAIIDISTWEKVQSRMKDNKKKNATNTAKNTYLLTGLIECGKCGGNFTGKTNTSGKGYRTRYYTCNNKYRTRTYDAANINADDIEQSVVAGLRDYLLNSDFEEIADNVMTAYEQSKGGKVAERKELAKLQTELQNCVKAIRSGLDIPEMHDEVLQIRTRISELEEALSWTDDITISREMIIAQLQKDAEHLDDESVQRLIKSYITKIYAHNDSINITGGVNMVDCGGRI